MAKKLPKCDIIQSNSKHRYLHYYTENTEVPEALRFNGDYSFDLDTRFQVEPATKGAGLFHIRSLHNNKYWANSGGPNRWITAMAVKPEENQSDEHCTLFQPIFLYPENTRVLRLRHVSSGCYVSNSDYSLLCLENSHDDAGCTFLDWEDIVVLPDLIKIKGDNGSILGSYGDGSHDFDAYMSYRFEGDEHSDIFVYEVSLSRDGGIRLKCRNSDRYWTAMDNSWVWLQKASTKVHDISTIFLPRIEDGNRILMRSLKNGYFCKRHTVYGKSNWINCLAVLSDSSDKYSYIEIEEAVISRKIKDVEYRLADARIYNEKTAAIITDKTINNTQVPQTTELNLKTKVSNTTNWSTSQSVKAGVKLTCNFTVPIPYIPSGSLEISTEYAKTWDSGETQTESLEVGSVRTVTVPAGARVEASLMATRVSYEIPFSYTQHDILLDRSKKESKKNDGIFRGTNGYDYICHIDQFGPDKKLV